jgi:hypothetical protein
MELILSKLIDPQVILMRMGHTTKHTDKSIAYNYNQTQLDHIEDEHITAFEVEIIISKDSSCFQQL